MHHVHRVVVSLDVHIIGNNCPAVCSSGCVAGPSMIKPDVHKHALRITVVVSGCASNLGIEAEVKGRATLHAGNAISVAQA